VVDTVPISVEICEAPKEVEFPPKDTNSREDRNTGDIIQTDED
jgi:hypothetical protein